MGIIPSRKKRSSKESKDRNEGSPETVAVEVKESGDEGEIQLTDESAGDPESTHRDEDIRGNGHPQKPPEEEENAEEVSISLGEVGEDVSENGEIGSMIGEFREKKTISIKEGCEVYFVENDRGQPFCLKRFRKCMFSEDFASYYASSVETKVLFQLRKQPLICKLKYSYQTPSFVYLVMEKYSGDLHDHLGQIKDGDAETKLFFIKELVAAIDLLQKRKITHRDIKPSNFLLSHDGHIRLSDFGISTHPSCIDPEISESGVGTLPYIAPEIACILRDQMMDPNAKPRPYRLFPTDVWSLGIICYDLFERRLPFGLDDNDGGDDLELLNRILGKHQNSGLVFQKKELDPAVIDFITRLLERNPEKRLGSRGINEIKNHRLFEGTNWRAVEKCKMISPFVFNNQGEFVPNPVWEERKRDKEVIEDEDDDDDIEILEAPELTKGESDGQPNAYPLYFFVEYY